MSPTGNQARNAVQGNSAPTDRRRFAGLLSIAAVVPILTFILASPNLAQTIRDEVGHGMNDLERFADILGRRSPGPRAEGALANLKPSRHQSVQERALAKVRMPGVPPTILASQPETLVPALPDQQLAPAIRGAAPLYELVARNPAISGLQADQVPGGPVGAIGPIFTQPATAPLAPSGPQVSAVPEPTSWILYVVGFGLIGGVLRRKGRRGAFRFRSAPVAVRNQ